MEYKAVVLDNIEAIQKRPGMYIGSTEEPTHLIKEVIDNSQDEIINNHADKLEVIFKKDNIVVIKDNGRGLPIHDITLPDTNIVMDSIVAIATKTHSGAKFDTEHYKTSKGLHGVGLTAVNALSEYLRISVYKNNNIHDYKFTNGKFISKEIIQDNTIDWSTRIEFKPSSKYFDSLNINKIKINKELLLFKSLSPRNINISINNKELIKIDKKNLIFMLLDIKDEQLELFNIFKNIKEESIELSFTYDLSSDKFSNTVENIVNYNQCDGKFVNTILTKFFNILNEEFNIDKLKLTKSEIFNYFRLFINLNINEPKYSSQTKEHMVKNISYLLDNEFDNNLKSIILSDNFQKLFQKLLETKLLKKLSNKIKNNKISVDNPLYDCSEKGEILYIVEGESAKGNVIGAINKEIEAVFPISGKIISSLDKSISEILSSIKLQYLAEAIGLVNLINMENNNLRYNKFKIICDADVDGMHIITFIIIALYKLIPNKIKSGDVSIIIAPTHGAIHSNKYFPIYGHNEKEISSYKAKGYFIKTFKGLGSMSIDEFKPVIRNPNYEFTIKYPETEKENIFIEHVLENTEYKKKLINSGKYSFDIFFKSMLQQK